MKYVLILCLYLVSTIESKATPPSPSPSPVPNPDTYTFASVREYPLYLHRCMATFLAPSILLTTAECVLCADECKLQVRAFSNHLSGNFPQYKNFTPESFNVTEIHYHPDYPVYPETHNVALIVIDGVAPQKVIYEYANFTSEKFGFAGYLYSWQFSKDMKDYLLQEKEGETVSNTACSFSLNKYVSYSYICVMGDDFLSMGPFDQGSPFITQYNNKRTVVGIYDDSGFVHRLKFVTYQSLSPFFNWIDGKIHGHTTVTPPQPTKKPTTKVTKTTTHRKTTKPPKTTATTPPTNHTHKTTTKPPPKTTTLPPKTTKHSKTTKQPKTTKHSNTKRPKTTKTPETPETTTEFDFTFEPITLKAGGRAFQRFMADDYFEGNADA